jgi:multiple antibiotic resistance protein
MLQMNKRRPLWRDAATHLQLRRQTTLAASAAVGISCLLGAASAVAAEVATGQLPGRPFPIGHIFTFLFLMLGPFKIIGPFAKITKGADASTTRQVAVWGVVFASLALAFAAMLGERMLGSYGIPLPVLALAAGIILFLVALLGVVQQFTSSPPNDDTSVAAAPVPAMKLALAQLAFPTIVTPYGIAALVVFMALSPDLQGRLTIGAILLVIMLLNLMVMLVTKRILPVLGLVLPILGAVLGVVQVALGLQIINNSLRALLAL